MSTTLFGYISSINTVISPLGSIVIGINCLVHIPMYWYFAFPQGFLYPYRQFITRIQIIQHVIAITCAGYSFMANDCDDLFVSRAFGLALYIMYLAYFAQFYIIAYLKKEKLH